MADESTMEDVDAFERFLKDKNDGSFEDVFMARRLTTDGGVVVIPRDREQIRKWMHGWHFATEGNR